MATATTSRCGISIDPNDYYRPKDICELLGVSARTVSAWLNPPPGRPRLRCWRQGGNNKLVIIRGAWLIEFFEREFNFDGPAEETGDQG